MIDLMVKGIEQSKAKLNQAMVGLARDMSTDINQNVMFSQSPAGSGSITLYINDIKYNTDEYIDSSITDFVESMVRRGRMYGRA